ncbi:anti-sigma factor [Acidisphaera sp. L21]|uniref:anti-sigma factor family protein n=1 Tax=Acidisphaera sp. L21 TaxID=1641851 RepID=UPI00131D549F|nr:anti-sigma factor [Acidisphaera sp. L21]
MSEDGRPIGEDDIEAYVDGRLSVARRDAVGATLANAPALQARVDADLALRHALRERLAPIAEQPLPSRLRVATLIGRRRARLRRSLSAVAASVLLLAIGVGAGWEARGWNAPVRQAGQASTAVDAIEAHRVFVVEKAHPVEVAAAQEAHLVQWLSRRVGHTLKVPDLSAQGYELMGGRLIPEAGEAAAQFMFQDGAGGRLTLFVKAGKAGPARFAFLQSNGYAAFSWNDDALSFALVAAVERPVLLTLAEATYRQLDPSGTMLTH